ncbi:MAG: branched-chain amino acid transport system ATP-binding protein [Parasphingorhabdus sp.]|jgi:branched-chain amino acid transport system ATP-binding protein
MTDILSISELKSGYGEISVLHGIDLLCGEGKITALVGSNGAGKSTLMRTIAGIVPTSSGSIRFDNEAIEKQPAHVRVERGLVMVPEGRLVFADMTVADNLRTGSINPRARDKWQSTIAEVYDLFPRLHERQRQLAGTLSGGEQQMLALGRGLMALPKMLLLDEPTLGLAPAIATQIFNIIPTLVARGISVFLAEQDLYRTLDIADYAYVVENGRITLQDTGEALKTNSEITQAYLGS